MSTEATAVHVVVDGQTYIRKDYPDLDFTVLLLLPSDHDTSFLIYHIEGYDARGVFWHRRGAPSSPAPVATLQEAEIYAHGFVKWDGCSNWHFDEQDRVMLHACSRDELGRFGRILQECYDLAAEHCTQWEGA